MVLIFLQCAFHVTCVDSVRDFGIWMDSYLSFDLHITKKCQIAHHQLHNLA